MIVREPPSKPTRLATSADASRVQDDLRAARGRTTVPPRLLPPRRQSRAECPLGARGRFRFARDERQSRSSVEGLRPAAATIARAPRLSPHSRLQRLPGPRGPTEQKLGRHEDRAPAAPPLPPTQTQPCWPAAADVVSPAP